MQTDNTTRTMKCDNAMMRASVRADMRPSSSRVCTVYTCLMVRFAQKRIIINYVNTRAMCDKRCTRGATNERLCTVRMHALVRALVWTRRMPAHAFMSHYSHDSQNLCAPGNYGSESAICVYTLWRFVCSMSVGCGASVLFGNFLH